MRAQKYIISGVLCLLLSTEVIAQCLSLPNPLNQKLATAQKIIEGKVIDQESFRGNDGNIYTSNHIEVYNVFKGAVGFEETILTEGGVVGELMQVVTPSVRLKVGDYGVFSSNEEKTTEFVPIDQSSNLVYGNSNFRNKEELYEAIARQIGTSVIELRRLPLAVFKPSVSRSSESPEVETVFPSEVTAGTRTVITISGTGFGEEQGTGHVAFSNADDGGQSFVALESGPHYLSWSDTEIQLYVPSATLYNNTVAGTGEVRVMNADGEHGESEQQVTVKYAKSEVVYNENLTNTMLVDMQQGGYLFSINQQLLSFLGGREMVEKSLVKWACNTGVNFGLDNEVVTATQWSHDDVNLIGLSEPGQLPIYLLGKTITTFSGCGTPDGLQWNLIEVDVVLNRDINWYIGDGVPASEQFDMETSILHELGHAHLLQHNNNQSSPMYFELLSGSSRRELHVETDIDGGTFVSHQASNANHVCGNDVHIPFDDQACDLSLINSISEQESEDISVYPNPFQNELTLSVIDPRVSNVRLYDSQGRIVLSSSKNKSTSVLNTAALPSGIYLLEMTSDQGRTIRRLVKN